MSATIKLSAERVAAIKGGATATLPEFEAMCDLAAEALATRAQRERVEHIIFGDGDRNRGVSVTVDMADLEKMFIEKLRTSR